MNTETLTVLPKGEDFEIIVQHDQTGSAYGITLSKNAYEQLRQHFVVCSAYYVHISGMGETCIVAENIADAMDKIEKLTDANYTFIFNRSLPCIV